MFCLGTKFERGEFSKFVLALYLSGREVTSGLIHSLCSSARATIFCCCSSSLLLLSKIVMYHPIAVKHNCWVLNLSLFPKRFLFFATFLSRLKILCLDANKIIVSPLTTFKNRFRVVAKDSTTLKVVGHFHHLGSFSRLFLANDPPDVFIAGVLQIYLIVIK
jgi:hypothetical protein